MSNNTKIKTIDTKHKNFRQYHPKLVSSSIQTADGTENAAIDKITLFLTNYETLHNPVENEYIQKFEHEAAVILTPEMFIQLWDSLNFLRLKYNLVDAKAETWVNHAQRKN